MSSAVALHAASGHRVLGQRQAMAAAFVLVWCSGYPAGKIAVLHGAPFTVLLLRFAIAGAVFAALAVAARVRWPNPADAARSALVGLLTLALSFGGIYEGLRLGVSSGISALFVGAMPLATALIGLAFGERLARSQWLGLLLGFAGVVLVLQGRIDGTPAAAGGYVASALGLVGLSLGTLVQRRHAIAVDLRAGLAIQHAVAALAMLPLAAFVEHFHTGSGLPYVGALAWIVVVNALGGFALLFALLRRGAATSVAALFYLIPPVTAAMGWLVLDERLSPSMLPGFALVAFGVWLGTRAAGSTPSRR